MRRPSRLGLLPVCASGNRQIFVALLSPPPEEARGSSCKVLFQLSQVSSLLNKVLLFLQRLVVFAGCQENEEEVPDHGYQGPGEAPLYRWYYDVLKFELRQSQDMVNKAIKPCILFFTIGLLSPGPCCAQETKELMSQYFSEVQPGNHPPAPKVFFTPENNSTTLKLLKPYLHDTLQAVRAKAGQMVHSIGSGASATEIRKGAVDMLIGACSDKDPEDNDRILEYLQHYRKQDFTSIARDGIETLVRTEPEYFDRILKLAGFLDLRNLIHEIRPWTEPGNPAQIRWAALLSLARMGDTYSITEVMRRVRRLPLNDDVVYRIFPDLCYTRQREAIDYVIEALHTNEKNCLSADAERGISIPCGYRIMEQLAPVIAGFPLTLENSGDLKTDNYPEALEKVRAWFMTNKTYTILNDTW